LRPTFNHDGERGAFDVTKAEFLDQLAGDDRIGSKKAAGDAVDAVLEAITGTLAGGGEVSFTGFGKFHVAGREPAHRRADHDPGRQSSPLLRRFRAQGPGQGQIA
jgi:nucleoid DNA-binding protein